MTRSKAIAIAESRRRNVMLLCAIICATAVTVALYFGTANAAGSITTADLLSKAQSLPDGDAEAPANNGNEATDSAGKAGAAQAESNKARDKGEEEHQAGPGCKYRDQELQLMV